MLSSTSTIKKRPTRGSYATTSDSARVALVRLVVDKNLSIKTAAVKLQMNISTAFSVMALYERTGRIQKKYCNNGLPSPKKISEMQKQGIMEPIGEAINYQTIQAILTFEQSKKALI